MSPGSIRQAALVAVVASVVYISNLRLIAAGDSFPTALTMLTLDTQGTTRLDRLAKWTTPNLAWSRGLIVADHHGYHSVYPIGTALIAAPLVWPAVRILHVERWDIPHQVYFARFTEKLSAAVLTAIAAAIMFLLLSRLVSPGWAWALTAVYAFGTMAWPIASQALWQQTGGLFLLTLALWLFHEESFLAVGFVCALGITVRPSNLPWVIAFSLPLMLWRNGRALARLWAFPLAGVILTAAYNEWTFRNLLGVYGAHMAWAGARPLEALAGLLISPGRGVLFFSPVLALALVAPFQSWHKYRALTLASIALIVSQLLVVSLWPQWWGGWSWGWRLLTEMAAPLTILVALTIPPLGTNRGFRCAFAFLAAVSITVEATGAYCYPSGAWDSIPRDINIVDHTRLWDWRDTPVTRSLRAGPDDPAYHSLPKLLDKPAWIPPANAPADALAGGQWWRF